MSHSIRPRVLLVGVLPEIAATLRTELGPVADLHEIAAEEITSYTDGVPGERHPTLVVLGRQLPAPVGLVHAVRPHPGDLTVIAVSTPANAAKLATLPLLLSSEQARQLPAAHIDRLPQLARQMLQSMARRRTYTAGLAAAQRQLTSGAGISRQLGDHLFGEFLTQAPVGAIMLDGSGALAAWNHRAAEILALTDPGSLGHPLAAFFPTSSQPRLADHIAAPSHQRAADPDAVFERIRPDGNDQALRLAPQQVLDPEGRKRTLLLVEDVTARLRAERLLAERTSQALLSAEVAAAITAPGPLRERLHRCMVAAVNRLQANFACVWTAKSPGGELEHVACAVADTGEADALDHVAAVRPQVQDIAAQRRPHLGTPADARQAATIGFPLISGGELIGVLVLAATPKAPGTTADALGNIADQIAVGIQQDRLLDRLRSTAQALEKPLLPPHLPRLPGFDLAARYHPFGSGLQIGGDFYDVFTAPDGRHVLVLGDVCGKGPTAAAITGLVRHTLWAAAQHTADPAHVLTLVDQALRRENTPFCTLIYAVLDPAPTPARLQLVAAGHPPPLLRRADGTTTLVNVRGPLLGAFGDVHHPVTEIGLHPGETLVLYTDGFTEGGGPYHQREPEELAVILAEHQPAAGTDHPADDIAGALMDEAHTWWGRHLRDDLAVLALTAV
ncbi:SpoIIE family protein phosphatase [Streptomyces sp. NPDC006368]|uniref:SpoIIE family protein phosphatase n=1 Tax=Streptomyces sp. NPDC006368 TaxID=3156760 RepID=UPI0033A5C785